ncbi:MAG: ribonuclease HII [Actinomycetia bacterium]|nr:ribonuclease HII [Actinomycetes bacterium]
MNSQELIAQIRAASGDELEQLDLRYRDDPRQSVRRALAQAARRAVRDRAEEQRLTALYRRLDTLPAGQLAVGIDEVGRGPLAGPLVVAAVVLPPNPRIVGLNDSKKLSAPRREQLAVEIKALALSIELSWITAAEIDRVGMARALFQAMREVLDKTSPEVQLALIDGRPMGVHPQELPVVHGDALEAPIAAASIIAKVSRDAWMVAAEERYPGYGFAQNKGYGSAAHIRALSDLGPSPIHRQSFLGNILPV